MFSFSKNMFSFTFNPEDQSDSSSSFPGAHELDHFDNDPWSCTIPSPSSFSSSSSRKIYDTLVISGGSTKGFACLGALYYLIENSTIDLTHMNTFVGASAGSMICYLLAIGYTPIDILNYLIKNKVFEHINANVLGAFSHTGIYSFSVFTEHVEKMTIDKIGFYLTLGQVQKSLGKTLIFSTYNFTKNTIEYLTPETHPDLPCSVAIHMSSNLPFVFAKFKYNNSYYIDGGVYDNFPIEQVPDFGSKTIYGINIDYLHGENDLEKMNETEYLSKLFCVLCCQNTKQKIAKYSRAVNCTIMNLNANDIPFIGFSFNHKQLLNMFSSGYQCAKKSLELKSNGEKKVENEENGMVEHVKDKVF